MDKIYCIFGDSVAQGAYVKISWVDLLRLYLEDKYSNVFVNVFNLGIGGNTSADILRRFEFEAAARTPTTIVFAVGINDSKSGNETEFLSNLNKLASLGHKFSEEIIFVGLVLGNYIKEESYTRDKAHKFNLIVRKAAGSGNYKFIDLFNQLTPEDFSDGLHPNDQGHQKMFQEIKKYF